ncbi:UNVERIFIED_CONTAM: hypothetical protein Slati_2211500 [Sesamum latifolium]|uniref:Uncharacterized protein n=1 Tax=Sesamum latifolium TaxID=2727402 RepID=A0AAW2WU30_9LAMI
MGLKSVTPCGAATLGIRAKRVAFTCLSSFPVIKKSCTALVSSSPMTGQAALKKPDENRPVPVPCPHQYQTGPS